MALQNTKLAPKISLPLRYFIFGLISLGAFGLSLSLLAGEVLTQHHYVHRTIALTHLLVLGWIATVVLGATFQLVPVALGVKLHSERLGRWIFIFHAIGVTGMVASFWLWDLRLLLWFGSLVIVGFSLFAYNLFRTLRMIEKHDLVSVHAGTSTVYLVLTFLAGQYLMHDKLISFSPFYVLAAIHAHAHLAGLGWFILLIVGVSYRLVPMFTLSEIQSRRRAWSAYAILNVGILALFIGILLQKAWLPLAAGVVGLGLGLWAWEMIEIFRKRKRTNLDGALKQIRVAIVHGVLLIPIGLWLSFHKTSIPLIKSQAETGYAIVALLGFISLFIMAMLYKIIPFLVWYNLYSPWIGKRPVPQLHDLYSGVLEKWAMRVFVSGMWLTTLATTFAYKIPSVWVQAAAAILGLGILMVVYNLSLPLQRLVHFECPIAKLYCHLQKHRTLVSVTATYKTGESR